MAASTGPVLAAAGVTMANDLVLAPLAGAKVTFNWRVLPAAAGLALALAGLEKAAPGFAVGLAWLTVTATLIVPFGAGGDAASPIVNAAKAMGYQ